MSLAAVAASFETGSGMAVKNDSHSGENVIDNIAMKENKLGIPANDR